MGATSSTRLFDTQLLENERQIPFAVHISSTPFTSPPLPSGALYYPPPPPHLTRAHGAHTQTCTKLHRNTNIEYPIIQYYNILK